MKCMLLIVILAGIVQVRADVVPSKDSLKVYNNIIMSATDGLYLVNEGVDTVILDSVRIVIDEIAQGEMLSLDQTGVMWRFYRFKDSTDYDFMWYLHKDSTGVYKLISETGDIPESIETLAPGDSITIQHFEIGDCFTCSALPRYPAYIRGTLLLYYSNETFVAIRLYSQDLRTVSTKKPRSFLHGQNSRRGVGSAYLLNGRKVERGILKKRYQLPEQVIVNMP